jgi:tetratricopeptide (TPR) repeat protein
MKKLFILALILSIGFVSFGQKSKKEKEEVVAVEQEKPNRQLNVYNKALKYGDALTAINALYYVIDKEGENSTYRDSLAYLYFNIGKYNSCAMLCNEILEDDPSKTNMLELLAVSQKSMGDLIPSIATYEKLLPMTKSVYHAYNLAELQYTIKRLAEAYLTIQEAEKIESTPNDKIAFTIAKNQTENVNIKAAIYNLKGLIEYELNPENREIARASFEQALMIEPEFTLAKNNMSLFAPPPIKQDGDEQK